MLNDHLKMYAYPFKGYWKDVGTIQSLWEANQDLLGAEPLFDIYDPEWKIHSRNAGVEPQFIAKDSVVKNSLIAGGAKIHGTVVNSIIGAGVVVKNGAVVKDSVILSETQIGENAVVEYSIIDEKVTIGAGAQIGKPKEESKGISVIGRSTVIFDNEIIEDNQNIECDARRGN